MIQTVDDLKKIFDTLLGNIKGSPLAQFTKTAEIAYEAVICAHTINEYAKVYGAPMSVINPVTFLNQKGGKFNPLKAFKVQFPNETFYFATDVECYGLAAYDAGAPIGDIFEADIVVINEKHEQEIKTKFSGIPAPQHLDAAYECKFGKYEKSQLRELLGFRRHVSYITDQVTFKKFPFSQSKLNTAPPLQVILFRPTNETFFTKDSANLYNLQQIVYP